MIRREHFDGCEEIWIKHSNQRPPLLGIQVWSSRRLSLNPSEIQGCRSPCVQRPKFSIHQIHGSFASHIVFVAHRSLWIIQNCIRPFSCWDHTDKIMFSIGVSHVNAHFYKIPGENNVMVIFFALLAGLFVLALTDWMWFSIGVFHSTKIVSHYCFFTLFKLIILWYTYLPLCLIRSCLLTSFISICNFYIIKLVNVESNCTTLYSFC